MLKMTDITHSVHDCYIPLRLSRSPPVLVNDKLTLFGDVSITCKSRIVAGGMKADVSSPGSI